MSSLVLQIKTKFYVKSKAIHLIYRIYDIYLYNPTPRSWGQTGENLMMALSPLTSVEKIRYPTTIFKSCEALLPNFKKAHFKFTSRKGDNCYIAADKTEQMTRWHYWNVKDKSSRSSACMVSSRLREIPPERSLSRSCLKSHCSGQRSWRTSLILSITLGETLMEGLAL